MVEGNDRSELPRGWVWTKLEEIVPNAREDIVDGPFGSNMKASEYVDKGIPIIRLQNISRNQFVYKNIRFISPKKAAQLKRHSFSKDDIVITKLGSPLGEACLVPSNIEWGILVADVVRVRTNDLASRRYLTYCINSPIVIGQFGRKTKGTTRPRVNLGHIRELDFPLPPLPEQYRIVNKIEEAFTRLDAGVEALKKAKAQLKRYRQAVLKAAMSGELTRKWREAHKGELEPASVLLARIKEERKKRLGSKYKELPPPDTAELPELPEGWAWANFELLISLAQNGFGKRSSREGNPIIVLRLADIVGGTISLSNTRRICAAETEVGRYKLDDNDLLCIRVNGSRNLVGRMIPYKTSSEPIMFCDHFIRFRLIEPTMAPFLSCWFNTDRIRRYMELSMISSAGQNTVGQGTVLAISFPLPPQQEQHQIMSELERRYSIADEAEQIIDLTLRQSDRLRQSILKRAFEGKLVPQDPSDEPAEKLLDRIKAEKARNDEGATRKRRRKNAETTSVRSKGKWQMNPPA